jgi:hypothetical protein
MKKIHVISVLVLVMGIIPCSAQQFSALEGSIYGSIVNTAVQPAAGANMPYRWGVEVVGLISFWNNNIYAFSPVTLNGSGKDANGYFLTGASKRWGNLQADVHLLNFLFRWPRQKNIVVGAGWNLHSTTYVDKLDYLYEDSMTTMGSFLQENVFNTIGQGRVVDQQWMEWYVTASTVILDNPTERFTAGATLKLLKGISAVAVDLDAVSVALDKSTNPGQLAFTMASGRYGYSKNLEELDGKSSGETVKTLMNGAPFSPGIDLGITYVRKKQTVIAGFTNDDPAGYDWKLEVALTDLGRLKYPLGDQSVVLKGPRGRPAVERLTRLTDSVSTLESFNDTLATMAVLEKWPGAFSVSLPTALRINVDKNLGTHFYVNARLVLDMSFLVPGVDYKIRQDSYLMLTPRWEVKRFGVYAPLYLNVHGSLMAGAALRLGPLVAGVHDLGWLFRNRAKGGAYVGLVIKGLFKKKDECPSL